MEVFCNVSFFPPLEVVRSAGGGVFLSLAGEGGDEVDGCGLSLYILCPPLGEVSRSAGGGLGVNPICDDGGGHCDGCGHCFLPHKIDHYY